MSTIVAVSGLLISSTGSALLRKVLYQLDGYGVDGTVHTFKKPWFTTFESALACWVTLLLFALANFATRCCGRARRRREARVSQSDANGSAAAEPLLPGSEEEAVQNGTKAHSSSSLLLDADKEGKAEGVTWAQLHKLMYPGIANVVSILVQGAGLRYINASVSQMLSGSCILFTAGLSVVVLRAKLNKLHYIGISLACVGVTIVSAVTILAREEVSSVDIRSTILGVGLTLVAMAILAVRLVLEELLLDSMVLHPMQARFLARVLGYEGAWGSVFMAVLGLPLAWLLPGSDVGNHEENTLDSLAMLWRNGSTNAVNMVFFWSVVGLNVFGLMVTQTLGSVFRAVLLTTRTASVWAVNLALYALHVGGSSRVGEPWSSPESWVQLGGFVLLLAGTVVYAQGSSPAIDDDGEAAKEGNEEDLEFAAPEPPSEGGDRPEGPAMGHNIAQLRPYYSVYVPRTPARAIRPRRPARQDVRHCSSLPTEGLMGGDLTASLPGRRRTPRSPSSDANWDAILPPPSSHVASDGEAQHPQQNNPPAFVRTLLSRKSWFLDAEAARGVLGRSVSNAALGETVSRGGSLRGDSPRSYRGTSSDVESPAAAGGPSRRKGPQAGGGGHATGGVRWSDGSSAADEGSGDGSKALGAQPGASPTPELLLERRVLGRRLPAHLQTVGEASESGSPLSGEASGHSAAVSEGASGRPRSSPLGTLVATPFAAHCHSPISEPLPSGTSAATTKGAAAAIPARQGGPPEEAAHGDDLGSGRVSRPEPVPAHEFGMSPTAELTIERRMSARQSLLSRLPSVDEAEGGQRTSGGVEGRPRPAARHFSDLNPNAPAWTPGGPQ